MSRWTSLLVFAGLLLAVAAYAQPANKSASPPSIAALQAQIATLTKALHDLQAKTADATPPPKASLDQLVRDVDQGEKKITGELVADETTFDRFKKGESDRVAQDTQLTLGWFNTIATVGGGIVTLTGLVVTLVVVGFSIYTGRNAKAVAEQVAKLHMDDNQKKIDTQLEELRAGVAAVSKNKRIIEKEAQSLKKVHDDLMAMSDKIRENWDSARDVSGNPGSMDDGLAGGTRSALDTYNQSFKNMKANLDKGKYVEAFRDLEKAERVAPTRKLGLVAIEAQASVLSARGANSEAIALLQEKLTPFRDVDGGQYNTDDVKQQAATMLIRLGQLYKDTLPVNSLRAYDDACRLVERSDEPAALRLYASAQMNKAYRQRQANLHGDAIASYRLIQSHVARDASLRSLLAAAIFTEGETFQTQAIVAYQSMQAAGDLEDWQSSSRSAIACFERLATFAQDDDQTCRQFCADGLINEGILHAMLIASTPEERTLAVARLSRVEELFGQDPDAGMKERVEKARFLLARLTGIEAT